MEYIRSFLAIEINKGVISRIAAIQEEFKNKLSMVKWVKPENMHLTLLFFGSISLEELDRIKEVLSNSIPGIKPFSIRLKSLGTFPDPSRPRVLWVGVREGSDSLESLYKRVRDSLKFMKIKEAEREFHPHLTLGRFKSPRVNRELRSLLGEYRDFEFGEDVVDRVILFKSDLKPDGPIYTKLKEIYF